MRARFQFHVLYQKLYFLMRENHAAITATRSKRNLRWTSWTMKKNLPRPFSALISEALGLGEETVELGDSRREITWVTTRNHTFCKHKPIQRTNPLKFIPCTCHFVATASQCTILGWRTPSRLYCCALQKGSFVTSLLLEIQQQTKALKRNNKNQI